MRVPIYGIAPAGFDARVRETLGYGAGELLRRYRGGEFDAVLDDPTHPAARLIREWQAYERGVIGRGPGRSRPASQARGDAR